MSDKRRELLLDARHHVARQHIGGRHAQDKVDAEDWLRRYEVHMAQFKVWDALNGDEETACVIEASDAQEAATLYAENDSDGQLDGIYNAEQPICVRVVKSGELGTFQVHIEMTPSFVVRDA